MRKNANVDRARSNGRSLIFILLVMLGALAITTVGSAFPNASDESNHVSFTLEGCRNDGSITLPNGSGDFICPDAAYTTGNLGKGWNELDLVPHRLTTTLGSQSDATTDYKTSIAGDGITTGKVGWDVISVPVVNTSKSDASCTVAAGAQSTKGDAAHPFGGGTDTVIYRDLTIHQNKGTTCVFDYYQRLALGSHLYPGSSLQSYLFPGANLGGSKKTISIPVNQILPQELSKTMTAQQDTDHAWQLSKTPSPAHLNFGNTCDPNNSKTLPLDVTITWTKGAATPVGQIQVDTYITAINPAARSVTIDTLTDVLYSGTTQIDTQSATNIILPANKQVTTHFQYFVASGTTNLNDKATATYIDTVTGVPIPGSTSDTASATVQTGTDQNASASISDSESITGNGLDFSVASPSVGSFTNYTAGDFTTGPVNWDSGTQSDSGTVTFNKTVRVGGGGGTPTSTTGDLTDTATLTTSGGVTTNAGVDVDIQSSALGSLTINKTIPNILQGSEMQTFTFVVKDAGKNVVATPSISFAAGDTSKSATVSGLPLGTYTVSEDPATGWQPPQDPQTATIDTSCHASASFENHFSPASARVKKITNPAGFEGNWTFDLKDSQGNVIDTATTTGAGFVNFTGQGASLGEGSYSIVEETQPGWSSDGGDAGCSFTVDLPGDAGNVYSCTFTNTYQPSVDLTKNGDTLSKIGDKVHYDLVATNTSLSGGAAGVPNLVCTISDATIGYNSGAQTLAAGKSFDSGSIEFTIPAGASDPFKNTASVSCTYPSSATAVASDTADHSINLFQPSITVDKKANHAYSKAGDKVTYTVTITDTSSSDSPDLKLKSFSDSLVSSQTADPSCNTLSADPKAVNNSCTFTYDYVVQAGDADPLLNTATAHYNPDGFPNDITDNHGASVDLLHPSFTINKICTSSQPVPIGATSATFQVRLNNTGDADLVIVTDEGGTINLAAGGKTSFSVTKNGPFSGGTIDNTVNTTSVTLASKYGLDNVLTNQSASASCQRGGAAKVIKTVNGQPPSGTQSFTFTLRQGADTVNLGTILDTQVANSSNGGVLNFATNLVPGQHYQLCEDVMPGWSTNLGPNLFVPGSMLTPTLPNPNVNNLTVCTDFVAAAGQTTTFNVDNTPPPGGRALTIGFWKNWASCASSAQKKMNSLDLALSTATSTTTNPPGGLVYSAGTAGLGFPNYGPTYFGVLKGSKSTPSTAPDCPSAVNLLNKSTATKGTKMASDPIFNMTAQLVGAELNYFAGAGKNGPTTTNILNAVLLNGKYGFNGNTYSPKLSSADTTKANCLATQLDNYNNDRPVSAC